MAVFPETKGKSGKSVDYVE